MAKDPIGELSTFNSELKKTTKELTLLESGLKRLLGFAGKALKSTAQVFNPSVGQASGMGLGTQNAQFGGAGGTGGTQMPWLYSKTGAGTVAGLQFGFGALGANTSGGSNAAFGYQSLKNNTASNNSAFGDSSLLSNTSGNYNTAVGLIKNHDLYNKRLFLAKSDPAFEYWLLLHFERCRSPMSREEALYRLRGHLPSYEKSDVSCIDHFIGRLDTALDNADFGNIDVRATGNENPSTDMPTLIRYLQSLAT